MGVSTGDVTFCDSILLQSIRNKTGHIFMIICNSTLLTSSKKKSESLLLAGGICF